MKLSDDVCVIIAAAGKGARSLLGYNKALWNDGFGSTVKRTVGKFACAKQIIVACPADEKQLFERELEGVPGVIVTEGGDTRTRTIRRALALCECKTVLIHDCARPDVSQKLIEKVAEEAGIYGSAVPCTEADVALKKRTCSGYESVDRKDYAFVQTPQGFDAAQLKEAYDSVKEDCADDSEIWEKSGRKIHVVNGERQNVKLTYPYQFEMDGSVRIGTGFDAHRLAEGRKLILGGKEIPFSKGLDGHSDADVLTHAVMDALLSAAGLPDIGVMFPDNEPATEGISSMILLEKTAAALNGAKILSVSAAVMAQSPRLSGYIRDMRLNIAGRLAIDADRVNISATTTEKLGIVGSGEGMAASAVALIRRA